MSAAIIDRGRRKAWFLSRAAPWWLRNADASAMGVRVGRGANADNRRMSPPPTKPLDLAVQSRRAGSHGPPTHHHVSMGTGTSATGTGRGRSAVVPYASVVSSDRIGSEVELAIRSAFMAGFTSIVAGRESLLDPGAAEVGESITLTAKEEGKRVVELRIVGDPETYWCTLDEGRELLTTWAEDAGVAAAVKRLIELRPSRPDQ